MVDVSLYDAETVDELPWPETDEGRLAKNVFVPLMKRGARQFFDNIDTVFLIAKVDEFILPITVNEKEYSNSYVCSPYGTYFGFAQDHIQGLKNPSLRALARGALSFLEPFLLRGKINQVVMVNNWLFSTNLYPPLTQEQVHALTETLQKVYPEHTLCFRSIPSEEHAPAFLPNHYDLIPCRPVYVLDARQEEVFRCRMFKSDLKILERSSYEVVGNEEIQEEEIPRLVELYRSLYIDKYSERSPQLNSDFMALAVKNKLLKVKALKKEGRIDAVVGYTQQNGWMTSPLFGYDTSLPKEEGLYRMISTLVSLEAKKEKVLLNQSSGAPSYKKLRRAKQNIEYTAVYTRHLPWRRRLPWKILQWVMTRIGLKVIQKLEI